MAKTAARVDMVISNNATWEDAFQFGTVGDTSWDFNNKSFAMDVKGTRDDPTALLSLNDAAETIVVDDPVGRVLHLNVDDSSILSALAITENCEPYVYDLIMIDNSDNSRTVLMSGKVSVEQGVTV